jgi:serine/threonine protein kinase
MRHKRMELQHPNVNRLLNVFLVETSPRFYELWQVHQNIDPESDCMRLTELIETFEWNEEFKVEETVVVAIVQQILKGLRYLHSKGITMDPVMLPRSIFIDTATCDVRLLNCFAATVTDTTEGSFLHEDFAVTLHRAPEAYRGKVEFGDKADIYSLGLIAMKIAGEKPYANLNVVKLTQARPPITFTVTSTWSPAFRDFVNLCLEQDPNRRPSAEELLSHAVFQQLERVYVPDLLRRLWEDQQGDEIEEDG